MDFVCGCCPVPPRNGANVLAPAKTHAQKVLFNASRRNSRQREMQEDWDWALSLRYLRGQCVVRLKWQEVPLHGLVPRWCLGLPKQLGMLVGSGERGGCLGECR